MKLCVIYMAKNWLPLKLSLLRGSVQSLSRPANNMFTVLQISSKSVHFRRSYSRTREHRFCPVEYFHHALRAYNNIAHPCTNSQQTDNQ